MAWGRAGRTCHCTGTPAAWRPSTAAYSAATGTTSSAAPWTRNTGGRLTASAASSSAPSSAPEKPSTAASAGAAAQRDVQRHHGALREADQRELAVAEPVARELGVEAGVEHRRARPHAGQQRRRAAVAQREPLPAEGRHVAGLGRVGRDEGGLRQMLGERRGELDQVRAVGADAMQQHHELARRRRPPRRPARSGEHGHRRCLPRPGSNRRLMRRRRPCQAPRARSCSRCPIDRKPR